jgi:hypothetical protein
MSVLSTVTDATPAGLTQYLVIGVPPLSALTRPSLSTQYRLAPSTANIPRLVVKPVVIEPNGAGTPSSTTAPPALQQACTP